MRNLRLLVIGSLLLSALYAPVLSEAAGVPVVSRVTAGTLCSDGWTSPSDGGSGTCSHHGGIAGGGSNSFSAPRQGRFGQPPTNSWNNNSWGNSWNNNTWGNSWSLSPISTPRPWTITPAPTIRPVPTLSPLWLTPLTQTPSWSSGGSGGWSTNLGGGGTNQSGASRIGPRLQVQPELCEQPLLAYSKKTRKGHSLIATYGPDCAGERVRFVVEYSNGSTKRFTKAADIYGEAVITVSVVSDPIYVYASLAINEDNLTNGCELPSGACD